MKKFIYLLILMVAIAAVASVNGCGGVHPPAKKDTTQDTTKKADTTKSDTAAAKH
jgi:hypothetical protein